MLSDSKNTHQSHKVVAYPYQRRPVIVKGEDDSTEESLLFRKGKGVNQNRAHSASDGNRRDRGNASNQRGQGIPREIVTTADTPSYTTEDLDHALSTKGQELYIVDGRDSRDYSNDNEINRAQGIPAWSELGVVEEEDTSPFDNDVEWLLSAKDSEYKDYYDNKLRDTKDILLKDITQPRSNGIASSGQRLSPSLIENHTGVPIDLAVNTHQSNNPTDGNKILNSKLSSPSTSKPASGRLTPKPVSPKSQKYYSWYDYRSPPRSRGGSPKALRGDSKSPDKRDSSPKSDLNEENKLQKKKKDKKTNQEDDPALLLSKSMPVFPSSVDSSSIRQGSTSQESDKRSLQGLTHLVFEGTYTESPYVEHLTRPNHALVALQNPMFKNRPGMKGLNLAASPTSAKRKKMKAYAIIKDDANQLVLSSTNPASSTKFPPIPSRNTLMASNSNNKNASNQSRYNSNSLLESVYEKPDALYRKTKDQIVQNQQHSSFHPTNALSNDRGRARLVSKRGVSNYPYQPGGGIDVLYGNFINSHPTSPAIMRALSPPTLIDQQQIQSTYSNNIDQLITTMNTEATTLKKHNHSRSSPNVLMQNLFPNGRISPNILSANQKTYTAGTNNTASTIGSTAAEGSEGRYDAMEMLSNIHIDPLYRIIRDEIEALLQPKTSHNNSSITGGSLVLATSTISHHTPAFHASNIKTLTNFQSLPPSAWVICRIVYFLIMAYYETIIIQPQYLEYRKLTQLEPIWKILDRHYSIEKLNVNSIHQIFSWPYLQEIMLVGNNAFVKLLEIIEFGAQLTSAQWRLFQDNVRKDLFKRLNHPGVNGGGNINAYGEFAIPIESITNNETSRNLFYDLFPIPALGPLRMMVNAAKGFILAGATTAQIGPSNGKPATLSSAVPPGTPLAVTITMTGWLKRIIALVYVSTTQRLKEVKVSPVQFIASQSQTPPEAFDQTVPLSSEPMNSTFGDLNTGVSERPTIMPPSMDTMSVMNKALLQENQFFPHRLSFLLILHHPSALRYPSLPAYNDGRMMMNQNSHELSAIGEESSAVFRGVPAYFQLAAALVKPADELKILIMKPVTNGEELLPMNSQDELEEIGVPSYQQKKNRVRDEFTLMKKDIKKHLRITSASPLHTVMIHPMENYYLLKQRVSHSAMQQQQQQQNDQNNSYESAPSSFQPSNNTSHNNVVPLLSSFSSLAQLVQDCFVLHDGLTYCLQRSFPEFFTSSVASISSTSNVEVKKIPDILFTEFHIGKKNQPMIKVKKSTEHSTEIQHKAEEELKTKLSFSLGLINDSMSVNSGHVTRLRGSRYAICVTDSMNSWNAFELTKKVARESDSIFLYHIPMISYWDLRVLLQETTLQAPVGSAASLDHYQSHEPQPSDYQRSSLTYQQYHLLYEQIEQKKEKIVSLYRNMGYNVFIGGDDRGSSSQEYMEIVQRLMKSYSLMMRYNAELYEQELSERQVQQQSHQDIYEGEREEKKEKLLYEEETPLPQERYLYYQYNEEMRHYCRKLLLAMTSLEADYVILGADPNDVFDSLSNSYENSFLQFEAYPIEEFTYEVKYVTPVTVTTTVSPPRSSPTSPPKLIQMPSMTSQFAPSEVTSHEDYVFIPAMSDVPLNTGTNDSSAVMSLFEDKAIILGQGKSQDRGEGEGEGAGSFGEPDEYEEDWSDERSQTKLNKAPTSNKDNNDSNPNDHQENDDMITNDQLAVNNNTEYDLDSFIVEDNDEEGVDSLTASPFMLDRHHVTHAYELEREQLQHSHLHETLPDPIDNTAVGLAPPPQPQKIITRKRIAFNKKHLKYYQQYSERPVSFITMLLHEAMTIDQWADESNQSIAESVISPSSVPGGSSSAFSPTNRYKNQQNGLKKGFSRGEEKKEKSPLGFFSFILANSPFISRDHQQQSNTSTQQQPTNHHHHGGYQNGNLLQ